MFLTRQKPNYPTAWRTRFALYPVQIGEDEGRKIYIWGTRYEARWLDEYDVERRLPAHAHVQLTCKVNPWWA